MAEIVTDPIPGALATSPARLRAAGLVRTLSTALLAHEADDTTLDRLCAAVQGAVEELRLAPPRQRSLDEILLEPTAAAVADGDPLDHFDQCFLTGAASPVGLASRVRRAGDGLVLTTEIPLAFEGMPGFAHGGILAAVFDDLVGLTIGRLNRISAPTVHLEVDYRRPVPLNTAVEFRSHLDRQDGRKRFVAATASIDGEIYAQAQGLLIVVEQSALSDRLR